jgi:hypothetical protein
MLSHTTKQESTMKLQEMSTKLLLGLHNAITEASAGPKSFATKTKLIARIESIVAYKDIDLASFCSTAVDEVAAQDRQPQTEPQATEHPPKPRRATTDRGIGRLARELLLDPAGYSQAVIAKMINARVEGAQPTAKSVRWYACNMKKTGTEVPARRKRQIKADGPLIGLSPTKTT